MKSKPAYFEPIRLKSARRWEQLAQDPELAGPWHLLFQQVQSPRHILSELLQNADDAGATEASVRIENQVFVFEHNGEDFAEEHFASLCRFGYSNKRALHTIGFRGIGFKSTFSLGDCVELFTPTLTISFACKRFTEPRWLLDESNTDGTTRIRVKISDQHRQKEVEKNLEEWLKSPVSLLFFRNIRRIQIGDHAVHWVSLGSGPIPDSERMALAGQENNTFLLLRSEAKTFPEEALNEIRQERRLGVEDDTDFPPCKIEIVMGAKGRLFVVLPTGVETELPFACNAPFIQDPARLKIKDPETSPTNRWLLERAGQLAASAMLGWLGQSEMPTAERSAAYGLFPDVDWDDSSLEGVCGTIAEEAFAKAIDGRPMLLTEDGGLAQKQKSIIIPREIVDIWPAEQASALLDDHGRPALCQHIATTDREKLLRWAVVEEIDKQKFVATLQSKRLPKPKTWRHLLNLWAYIAPEINRYHFNANDVKIIPVQGKDDLYAAGEVVRLGEKKILQSDEDWDFLAAHMLVLNQNWPRFLAERRRTAADQENSSDQEAVEAAYMIMKKIGLEDSSNVDKVIEQVAAEFFAQESVSLDGCFQLAQIAAKLGASVGDSFRYVTRDVYLRSPKQNSILFDEDSKLEELLPEQQQKTQMLHADYVAKFSSCSQEEWLKWISSGRAGLLTFISLVQKRVGYYGLWQIEQDARKRGLTGDLYSPYVTNRFVVEDWDFEDVCWLHWQALVEDDDRLWIKVADRILSQRDVYWSRAKSARVLQVATTGNTKSMTSEPLLPGWVLRLRDIRCLPDTRGFPRKPGDLLRRTPATESLMDVELFVDGHLDTEATRPLLDLLGVQSTPTGPDRLLDCLRALAEAENPPIHDVEKWYRRLDQMVTTGSTTDFQTIRQAFSSEDLILTEDGSWVEAAGVFLAAEEEDVPGAAVIRSSVRDLTLWRKIGIAERPTADLVLQWLKELPSGQKLSQEDTRRVRALLIRYPTRIWEECAHWLNLAGEWTPTEGFSYALTMQSLIPWGHLHLWVKQETADLHRLSGEVTGNPPFSDLPLLAGHVEERFPRNPMLAGRPGQKMWLTTFGIEMRRVELDTAEDTQRVRAVAEILARTSWYATSGLEIVPYIDGTPVGTPRQADVVWLNDGLYVDDLPKAKLAKRVPEEIGKVFGRSDIKVALDYSFERSLEDVRDYLEENFNLAMRGSITEVASDDARAETAEEPATPSKENDAESRRPAADLNGIGDGIPDGLAQDARDDETAPNLPDDDDLGLPDDDEQDLLNDVEQGPVNALDELAERPRPAPKPDKPKIMERFALAQGFRKETDGRFFHQDGSWIGRTQGNSFPWERRTASGDLVLCYWAKDHCLEGTPLQLEADIWGLIDQHPETYALILANADGGAVEVNDARLRAMREDGEITLYPAAYRLVYNHDNQS